ncbi:MAG: transcriptional repressor LexA [Candidatus Omnitrophica bacterium]|nr:transcriptional repressor LexA [Candidatus Omnitrophota bacterium]
METKDLTHRQSQVLHLIRRHLDRKGAPPTIRELREGLKLRSLRGVTVHLDALVRKGAIERSRQARGIRILGEGPSPAPVFIPVVGRIAAGQPILAEQHVEERLGVDPRWVPGPGCFAVRVHGESMIGAGIMDGDVVIVRPQQTADNGEIVAVLIEGEATVKRFYRGRGGRIRLQPENPAIEPMFVHPRNESVRIMGKVVGLFRKL